MLASGATAQEIVPDFPYLTADDVSAVLAHEAMQSDHPVVIAAE